MVSFFRKKKEKEEKPDDFIKSYGKLRMPPSETRPSIVSREYKIFKKREEKRLGWFEFLAKISGKILQANPDENTKREMENAISFTGLRVTPQDVMALVILDIIFFVGLSVILLFSGSVPLVVSLFLAAFGIGLSYYFLRYPLNLLKSYRIKASSQVVLAVLYMVVSMRISPNLEQALRFASANVSGPLAWDMRRLIWDIEMRKYYSASHALTDYIAKWKSENEEFAEALRLIRDSQTHPGRRSEAILNEALDVILEGTKTRMKHYAQELSMPVTIIHMMGIILPVIGSIMAPLAAVFLAEMVRMEYFIIGYDVVLPVFLIWFINSILKRRPTTFSQVDTSRHPDLPPKGNLLIRRGKTRVMIPVLPISIAIGLLFIMPSVYFFAENPEIIFPPEGSSPQQTPVSLAMSCFLTLGIGFSLASYMLLTNFQRIRIQSDVLKTESEFELALFQLGNRISGGTPSELALEKSIEDVKDLSIAGLFILTLRNIKNLGMTFREALFHPKWGSVAYYPSRLIKNIMYMIVDISRKGFKYAAEGMLTVSKYLRNIRETQEYIRDLLQESVSSMTFQAYMLTPLVTGLIVSMAQIIIKVLTILTRQLGELSTGTNLPLDITGSFFGETQSAVSPEIFQLIIGIYLIEVIFILGMFLTKITQGENRTAQWYMTGKMLIVALSVYFLVAIGTSLMFGEMITEAVRSIGIT
ncbi:MAG: hypothetical protein GTN38_03080 [Candidatus Aenigmarchaeota archaeon]|nr:hypothetical protein [Candidatus Aenigmarchaeota archaeon]NIP40648.1 hypothetical protein [Candidatus Aenigmarchaeota archaeon]NIQ18454.1 hypothetical protein [Candidatus Aenigmarchaeota archaeon]NIS73353.1 hypothetical protein [Candidatus Aenigmarchaeota archaeon]